MRLRSNCWAVFLLVSLGASVAYAGPAEDKAAADALFRAGRALVKQGNYADGCPKLEASQKLDPVSGTLLALADCYELNGQTASAWTTFSDARAMARKANDQKRADEAQRRADLLEPKLSKIVIDVPADSRAEGLEVRRNGKLVEPAMYGLEVAIDPGPQAIDATAPGQEVWSAKIMVESKPGVTKIPIPSLVKRIFVEQHEDKPVQNKPPAVAPVQSGFGTQRTIGVVVAGVGMAGIIVGSVFGGQTLSKVNQASTFCNADDPPKCSPEGIDLHRQAGTFANISNIGIGVGAAALVGGIVMIAIAPSRAPKASSAFRITPAVAPGFGSLSLSGEF